MQCYRCRNYYDCQLDWKCSSTMYDCSAYKLEQTNEEYLRSLNTEQLAEVLSNIAYSSALRWNEVLGLSKEMETRKWTEWLKQPHTNE